MRQIGLAVFLSVGMYSQASGRSLTVFTLPGGEATCGLGIAGDGTVVGGDPAQLDTGGFLYQSGMFSFPAPNLPGGFGLLDINTRHVMVGESFGLRGPGAFILAGGVASPLTLPGAGFVLASAINDAGTIVGTYRAACGGPYLGFIDAGGIISTLDDGSGNTQPGGIDPSGRIVVGTSINRAGAITGFIYKDGAFTTLAMPGAAATFARGIDRRGRVSGTFFDSTWSHLAHGFLFTKSGYTVFDVPGASSTQLGSMNGAGEATGCFTDGHGTHGFRARL